MIALLDRMLIFAYKTNGFFNGFENEVIDGYRNHSFYENAEIALALPLCSEIARRCQHQCKKANESQPEMLIKPNERPMILMNFRGRLITIDPTKFEAKRPRADPYSHGYRCQNTNT